MRERALRTDCLHSFGSSRGARALSGRRERLEHARRKFADSNQVDIFWGQVERRTCCRAGARSSWTWRWRPCRWRRRRSWRLVELGRRRTSCACMSAGRRARSPRVRRRFCGADAPLDCVHLHESRLNEIIWIRCAPRDRAIARAVTVAWVLLKLLWKKIRGNTASSRVIRD